MQVGDLVKLAHYGTLVHKEEFEEHVVNKYGLGLITQVLQSGFLDQHGSRVDFMQVEVLWSKKNTVRIEDIEAVEVIN